MTFEPQYQSCVDLAREKGLTRLGYMSNETWHDDPMRLVFMLSRYKFVARMLAGKARVLEIGCGDAFGTRIVQQQVGEIVACDADPLFIADIEARMREESWQFEARVHNPVLAPMPERFAAIYALDVLEHIPTADEPVFMDHIKAMLEADGVLILGLPSLASQQHASPRSRAGHVNCKDPEALLALGRRHFENSFLFSMNDEVVHTGFYRMAHYYLLLACHPLDRP